MKKIALGIIISATLLNCSKIEETVIEEVIFLNGENEN